MTPSSPSPSPLDSRTHVPLTLSELLVKQERLSFLADNPFYTKRFAFYVGRRCRASPIRDVAKELDLDWHTVKALEQHERL